MLGLYGFIYLKVFSLIHEQLAMFDTPRVGLNLLVDGH